jgi:hypothetical protein
MLQAGKSRVRFPMRSSNVFNLPDHSGRVIALGLSQPLTEMSIRRSLWGVKRGRRHLRVDCLNLDGQFT